MNLPNKLTMLRVILIPFFIFFLLTDICGSAGVWIALGIFCVASFTDFLDGQIARRCNLVTNFGKFMDPLADKLLVCSALICYIDMKLLPSWFVIIIIAREFIISGFRLVASDNGVVIAASWWGKCKTVSQMVSIILFMVIAGIKKGIEWTGFMLTDKLGEAPDISVLLIIATVIAWISLVLTVISLIDYVVKNKDVMKDKKQ
jgi:CDP-diacylglycerol--glycerol-3-phosphate 3-phosphatidyltransferase